MRTLTLVGMLAFSLALNRMLDLDVQGILLVLGFGLCCGINGVLSGGDSK